MVCPAFRSAGAVDNLAVMRFPRGRMAMVREPRVIQLQEHLDHSSAVHHAWPFVDPILRQEGVHALLLGELLGLDDRKPVVWGHLYEAVVVELPHSLSSTNARQGEDPITIGVLGLGHAVWHLISFEWAIGPRGDKVLARFCLPGAMLRRAPRLEGVDMACLSQWLEVHTRQGRPADVLERVALRDPRQDIRIELGSRPLPALSEQRRVLRGHREGPYAAEGGDVLRVDLHVAEGGLEPLQKQVLSPIAEAVCIRSAERAAVLIEPKLAKLKHCKAVRAQSRLRVPDELLQQTTGEQGVQQWRGKGDVEQIKEQRVQASTLMNGVVRQPGEGILYDYGTTRIKRGIFEAELSLRGADDHLVDLDEGCRRHAAVA
mmetsp:Transcript_181992/g.442784  ORF Transcript_181992/g.442784 Transcript_181992/m.442784 type:complete len:374 (+) Transcript_181992:364-1485(+)